MKLLLVEDEKELSNAILQYLRKEMYVCEAAYTFDEATEKINLYQYDCIIVDLNLPGGSGFDLIRELKRGRSGTGIIIISARDALDDRLTGLDIGADDYLVKPFHLAELLARINSIIRRRSFMGSNEIILDDLRIRTDSMQVLVMDQPVELTRKEFELLLFLISNKNRVLTKESIAEHLWGDEMDLADSFDFIYTHIKNLRKKILDRGGKDCIKTVYGMGYKFITDSSA